MKSADLPLRYEPHALRRMRQRGVSHEQVERTVGSPDAVRPAKRLGAKRFEKVISRRKRLAVIAAVTGREIRIVSVWWM